MELSNKQTTHNMAKHSKNVVKNLVKRPENVDLEKLVYSDPKPNRGGKGFTVYADILDDKPKQNCYETICSRTMTLWGRPSLASDEAAIQSQRHYVQGRLRHRDSVTAPNQLRLCDQGRSGTGVSPKIATQAVGSSRWRHGPQLMCGYDVWIV